MQNKTDFSWERYNSTPIVGIIRGLGIDTVRQIVKAYTVAEFYTIEVTMNTPHVAEIITELRLNYPDLNVGAGTVCNMADLDKAITAGAQFIVTPILDEEVVKKCVAKEIPIFPGAYTPTEIYRAWTLGASAVKIFPATQLGTRFIKDVLAPLDEIKLMPTGGVSRQNIKSFFEAGVTGVGMGSSLFDKQMIKDNDFDSLQHHFTAIKKDIEPFCN
ncbi:bifunctional 4-hydroxy-2-oxoglutarate aldolase/2-dehydro-3-deoxy-phosphogluconate aldolase [Maribacter dokdonensis]|uniref:bifunctional 4-hydroxy-2-oxoglutarate aldolase/2-dehydro-3-deoxy-phosphogluconate aldolase n=1 Tax=Maribacter dokdonensis TaxID=320912 RepID=UPI002AAFDDC1|nr:bifunctional 4-hydroxy-2-oxoglutarate aldolase/2-dehydro-3-deoxy-phosphogluconate aldolase [Maribacter dokdonensis]